MVDFNSSLERCDERYSLERQLQNTRRALLLVEKKVSTFAILEVEDCSPFGLLAICFSIP